MDMIIDQNVMVAMRDGVRLASDIFRPAENGRYPVLLTRVPYDKDLRVPHAPDRRVYLELSLDVARVVAAGYVVVAQDTRGRFASEGAFTPVADEAADGADTIAWAAAQPWSSGQVGMFGESYQGVTQWLAAGERPAALGAIAPMHAPPFNATFYPYAGGAFQPAVFHWWALTQGAMPEIERRMAQEWAGHPALAALAEAELAALAEAEQNLAQTLAHQPQIDQPLLSDAAPYYAAWLTDPAGQAARHSEAQDALYPRLTVPALIIGGWYDYFLPATLGSYQRLRREGGSAQARQPRLIIGPWAHVDFPGMFAERDYGPQSSTRAINLTNIHLRWFDRWLKGRDDGEGEKPVRIFVMGSDEWRDEADWPLPDTSYRRYYLHSAGRAVTAGGDGLLSLDPPGDEPADSYRYDPRQPVPTHGGAMMLMEPSGAVNSGPLDQRRIEQRPDVLCYTTPPLERPVEVIGPITVALAISSSARDTDFTAKLVDVSPDGRAEILTDGILRARYRDSLTAPELLEPGAVYALRVDAGATANVFRAGHRIRLEISSSNFPRFDRNSNTGGEIALERAEDMQAAINHVHHDQANPSYLTLPVIERPDAAE
jgi:putative CocE/NonD family hydrolase